MNYPEHPRVLNSWKEIAAFINRGVRTVQRWEDENGLPVHRYHNGPRSAVYAFEAELHQWLRNRALQNQDIRQKAGEQPKPNDVEKFGFLSRSLRTADLMLRASIFVTRAQELRRQSRLIRAHASNQCRWNA